MGFVDRLVVGGAEKLADGLEEKILVGATEGMADGSWLGPLVFTETILCLQDDELTAGDPGTPILLRLILFSIKARRMNGP